MNIYIVSLIAIYIFVYAARQYFSSYFFFYIYFDGLCVYIEPLLLSEGALSNLNLLVILRSEPNNVIVLLYEEFSTLLYNFQFSYDTFSAVGIFLYTIFPLAIFLISLLFIVMLFSIAVLGNKVIPHYKNKLSAFYIHTINRTAKETNIFPGISLV